jgi:hypothetical protein
MKRINPFYDTNHNMHQYMPDEIAAGILTLINEAHLTKGKAYVFKSNSKA